MSNHADPWGLPVTPALSAKVYHRPSIERTGAPERVYDADAADPNWKPKYAGFKAPDREPLLWEGDGA